MLKITHIYKSYFPHTVGGCEHVIKTISDVTSALQCVNELITTAPNANGNVEWLDNISVVRYPQTFNLSSCPVSWKLYREFNKTIQDSDILHYHFPWPYADFLHLNAKTDKPTIVTYHSDIVRQKFLRPLYSPLMHTFLKKAQLIVATSKNLLDSSLILKPYLNKCHSIPNGINESDYFPVDATRVQYYKQKFNKKFMLFIGVLRYYKGLNFLLEAISDTDVSVVVVGAGPMEAALKRQANKFNINNVHFLGSIDEKDKCALLSLCRGVVLPSHLRSEAFGIVLVEGLMFGKPVISTEMGTGTSFVNKHGVTGLVVPPKNVAELRKALLELNNNDELVEKMGNAARKYYDECFTASQMGQAYFNLYSSLVHR